MVGECMRRRKALWIITILWAVLIFCFSAQPAKDSSKISNNITQKIIDTVPELQYDKPSQQDMISVAMRVVVRKTAHFFLYFILGILVLALLKTYPSAKKYAVITALIICILYAVTDEIHQEFVDGRSGRPLDVGIDGLGSFLGFTITYIINKLSPG